jgi:hypothetical protein
LDVLAAPTQTAHRVATRLGDAERVHRDVRAAAGRGPARFALALLALTAVGESLPGPGDGVGLGGVDGRVSTQLRGLRQFLVGKVDSDDVRADGVGDLDGGESHAVIRRL